MLYMFVLYWDPQVEPAGDVMEQHFALAREARSKDAYICSEAIGGTENATTVRVRGGKVLTTDGPFMETKEVFGGFYILDCKDLDEALEYAAKIPDAQSASVEIRPIVNVPGWEYATAPDRRA